MDHKWESLSDGTLSGKFRSTYPSHDRTYCYEGDHNFEIVQKFSYLESIMATESTEDHYWQPTEPISNHKSYLARNISPSHNEALIVEEHDLASPYVILGE